MQEERYVDRRRDYSAWHRSKSICRYVNEEQAKALSMIDLDMPVYVEYTNEGKQPLALIELAQDVDQPFKTSTVTLNLAKRAGIPCYVVLYELSDKPNPADPKWKDIKAFRIKRLYPEPENEWRKLTPQEWSEGLLKIREFGERELKNKPVGHR